MHDSLKLSDLSQRTVPTILRPDDSVLLAVNEMIEHSLAAVAIMADDGTIRLVTAHDLLRTLARGDFDPATPLRASPSIAAVTVLPDLDCVEALSLLEEGKSQYLAVLDAQGQLGGLLSRDALLAELGKRALEVESSHSALAVHQGLIAPHAPATVLSQLARVHARLSDALERAAAARRVLALFLIELDDFGGLLAEQGQGAGADILQAVYERISSAETAAEFFERQTGKGFIVARTLDPDLDSAVAAVQAAQALQQRIKAPLELPNLPTLNLTASLGVALYPEDGANVATLLRSAEAALDKVQRTGRGNISFYRPEVNQAARRRIQLEQELRLALAKEELRLLYQPIVKVANATIFAVEALLRWQHPRDGLLSPRDFIEAIEQSDLIYPVGRWVLEQAMAQAKQWLKHGRVRVSINVSGPQVLSGSLEHDLRSLLERTGLDPSLLGIEIQERYLLREPDKILSQLAELRALGVTVALDDFGVGYFAPNDLSRLPVDFLKIDMGFIRHLTNDPVDEAIVRSTIAMAHRAGIQVIAEGVETPEQLRYLSQAGCDHVQGFLLSRLIEAEAVSEAVKKPTRRMSQGEEGKGD